MQSVLEEGKGNGAWLGAEEVSLTTRLFGEKVEGCRGGCSGESFFVCCCSRSYPGGRVFSSAEKQTCNCLLSFFSHSGPYGKVLPPIGIVLIMVGLFSFLPSSWYRKCINCCRSNDKEADNTFRPHSEQLHSQVNC